MLELLSAILIIAVLTAMVTFFTASYIQWSQQVADQRTLVVLNDALTRYKCEGGDMNALTSGAPAGHIMSKLANTINWNGYVHQVMQTGVTYSSKSLTGAGYHQSFKFTGYNSYSTPVAPGQDIADRLASQGTPPDSATANWITTNATSPYYLVLSQPSSSTTIGMTVNIVGTLYVNWGDDTTATYSGSNVSITHTYASAGNYGVILSGKITWISATGASCAFGGDISTMPCLTNISINGTNTISGSVTAMTGLTSLGVGGSNTISGSVNGLTSLTNLAVFGNNSLSGSITGLSNLTSLNVSGNCTLSGDVTGKTGMTLLSCWGTNTITGSITGMNGLTTFSMGGSNTVTGVLSSSGSLGYIIEAGNSTITNPSDWSAYTGLYYAVVKNLSTVAATDNFLVSMDTNKNQSKSSGSRYIICKTNCATPDATGVNAKNDLISSGWSVSTN